MNFSALLIKRFRHYGLKTFSSYFILEVKRKIVNEFMRSSFSQRWEDLEIDKLLGFKKKGFYVDVGANDSARFNNTKRFYIRGWRGLNIEPNKVCCEKFVKSRPRDINLNIGIGNKRGKLVFYQFDPDTLSTFSGRVAREYKENGYGLIKKHKIPVRSLRSVFKQFVKRRKIDFLSIDTEGFDFGVLKSNDWNKFKPEVICIESIKTNTKIEKYLFLRGYRRKYSNSINSIYKLE